MPCLKRSRIRSLRELDRKQGIAETAGQKHERRIEYRKEEKTMANDKKLVEAITSMEEDFAQWYTDVVKKAELCD